MEGAQGRWTPSASIPKWDHELWILETNFHLSSGTIWGTIISYGTRQWWMQNGNIFETRQWACYFPRWFEDIMLSRCASGAPTSRGGGEAQCFLESELLCNSAPPPHFQGVSWLGELNQRLCSLSSEWLWRQVEGPTLHRRFAPAKLGVSPSPGSKATVLCCFLNHASYSIWLY